MCGGESGAAAAIPPRVPALSLVAGAHLPGGGGASPIPAGSSSPPLTFFHLPRRAASRPSDGTKRKGSPDCSACPYRPLTSGGQGVGQRNLAVTANTYTHVLADERELDYANLLAWARSCSRGADRGSDLAR
jgi:hypothetical protein